MNAELKIDIDFPGGNIIVDAIDGDVVKLHQDLRDTEGDWFYWAFRIKGAQGRKLNFQFTKSIAVGVTGAAVSLDEGETWAWTGKESVGDNSFTYDFPEDAASVRFCMAIPYQESNLNKFLDKNSGHSNLKVDTLCKTNKGRDAELLFLGCLDGEPEAKVVLTARHHSCESMANYVVEGVMQAVLDAAEPETQWLREKVEFMVVPFVDKDGVEDGDQGKNRKPHDHNRDYGEGEDNVHPTTRAIKELLPKWADGKLKVSIDNHCPFINGAQYNELIYFVGSKNEKIWEQQQAFSTILENFVKGILPFQNENNLPFGESWNNGSNYSTGLSYSRWVIANFPEVKLVSTIEFTYANAQGTTVDEDSYRNFGRAMAKALSLYLK